MRGILSVTLLGYFLSVILMAYAQPSFAQGNISQEQYAYSTIPQNSTDIQNVSIGGQNINPRDQSPNVQQVQGASAIAAQIGATMKANLALQVQTLITSLVQNFLTLGGLLDFLFFEQGENEQDLLDAKNTERIAVDAALTVTKALFGEAAAEKALYYQQRTLTYRLGRISRSHPVRQEICEITSNKPSYLSVNKSLRLSGDISASITRRSSGIRPRDRVGETDDFFLDKSEEGPIGDNREKFEKIFPKWCDPEGEGGNLEKVCKGQRPEGFTDEYLNNDINFAKTFMSPDRLTLDPDNKDDINRQAMQDFQTMMFPVNFDPIPTPVLARAFSEEGDSGDSDVIEYLLEKRRFTAIRSMAEHTFGELQARREGIDVNPALEDHVAKLFGEPDMASMKKAVEGVDLNNIAEDLSKEDAILVEKARIVKSLGEKPSRAAIIEVLARMQYLSPTFFASMSEIPTVTVENRILEAGATRAVVMKELLDSMLRTEAMTAGLLELMSRDLKDKVVDFGDSIRTQPN